VFANQYDFAATLLLLGDDPSCHWQENSAEELATYRFIVQTRVIRSVGRTEWRRKTRLSG